MKTASKIPETVSEFAALDADDGFALFRNNCEQAKAAIADHAASSAKIVELETAIAQRDSAMNDLRDKLSAMTNERDGLAEKYSPEITAEKKAAGLALAEQLKAQAAALEAEHSK